MATVTFDNATRLYPGTEKPAVYKLNIDIADGEFLVLVGPSGCGKSTSLRMLAGLEDVNAGRILIGDRDVTRLRGEVRDVLALDQDATAVHILETGEHSQAGGLATTGGADQDEELAVADLEVQLVDGGTLRARVDPGGLVVGDGSHGESTSFPPAGTCRTIRVEGTAPQT